MANGSLVSVFVALHKKDTFSTSVILTDTTFINSLAQETGGACPGRRSVATLLKRRTEKVLKGLYSPFLLEILDGVAHKAFFSEIRLRI